MRIGTKISAGFAAMIALTGVLGLAGWLGLDRYAGSVQGADQMAAIAEHVGSANGDATTFRANGDETAIARANASLQNARETAARIGATDLSEAIQRFENAFAEQVRLTHEAAVLTAGMDVATDRLEHQAEGIEHGERKQYAQIAQFRQEALELQREKLKSAQQAEALIRATLTARREEALFRANGDPAQAENTRKAIKGMFLAALGLKKSAGAGPEGELAGKLASDVSKYRQAFEALSGAAGQAVEAAVAAADLDAVSANIGTLAADVARMQIDSYNAARNRVEAAGAMLERAITAMTAALEMVADVRSLSIAQSNVRRTRGEPAAVAGARSAIDKLDTDLDRLAESATKEEMRDALTAAKDEITAYRSSFDAVLAAMAQEAAAAGAMAGAAQEVHTTVEGAVAAFSTARDSDGWLARSVIGAGAGTGAVLAILIALALGRSITRPLHSMTAAMGRLAADDLEIAVPGLGRPDEIGDIAKAVQVFKENALRMRRLEAEQEQNDRRAAAEKRRLMEELADSFEQSVGSVVQGLTGYIDEVRGRAEGMAAASEHARAQATSVASSSEEASANVQAVSAAAEELAASVNEIGAQVGKAAEMAKRASEEAQRGDARVQALADTSQRIGDVLTLIQDIAEQTNLLALNATIEAARAGEAGKGFAVVASEVKNLASQTAKATDDIRAQIEEIQTSSREAVSAIHGIGEAVGVLDQMNGAVAAAVEEQSATTNEIARNTQEAAAGSSQVSGAIVEVSSASERTGESAAAVLSMCGELAGAADTLDREVHDFLDRIRAS